MSQLLIKDRELVLPGQVLAEGMEYLPSAYVLRDKEQLVALKIGVATIHNRVIKLLPLTGKYMPRRNDYVIGRVGSYSLSSWQVDIDCPYNAGLNVRDATHDFIDRGSDLGKIFAVGDYIMAQITNIVGTKIVDLTMKGPGLRKLSQGRIIHVAPSKVPRIIGKQGSMINLIKDQTGVRISVGQNGLVWLHGEDPHSELLVLRALEIIQRESHISGLTDRIKIFLESGK